MVIGMRSPPPSERVEGGAVGKRLDRQLVAVMFTDIVGYTALMQTDERLGLDKRDRYMSALESHHDAFDGTIVQRLGDGSMSMFPSSLARCSPQSRSSGSSQRRTSRFASASTWAR
jgi:class 3 adenylate cyclase